MDDTAQRVLTGFWAGILLGLILAYIILGARSAGYASGRAALVYSLDVERARRAPRRESAAPVEEISD